MRRTPRLESLEGRRLLAGNVGECSSTSMDEAAEFSTLGVSAADAGSTRATSANVGSVDGTIRLAGSLGFFDRVDTIAFTVDRDAEVQLQLSGLNRDANLYLSDSSGNVLGRSTRFGTQSELISESLDAGEYFVTVATRSFWSSRYRLTISAELQPETPPDLADATPPLAPGAGTTLQDVGYFGGSRDWNLNAVGAPESWAAGYTGQGVLVAVVDTGVDLDHPDLSSNIFVNAGEIAGNGIDDDGNGFVDDVNGFDFADGDADPNDVGGHGTHVAGTIAAGNNGFGATGVAPGATILPVRVLGASGAGSTLDVAAGIRYAADLGADIINLSLGGGYSRAIDSAIDYARALGSFIVAAAGNESSAVPGFPARFSATDDNVISVGAYSSSGRLAGFSNDVGSSQSVQVDAPGVGIYSTYVGGRYATLSGTSMAAPHVAGLAALTLSANPDLTSPELRALLASGTVGRAVGSDAVGSVTAQTTVGYAAAGFGGSSNASSRLAGGSGNSNRIDSGRLRTTGIDGTSFDYRAIAGSSNAQASHSANEDTSITDDLIPQSLHPQDANDAALESFQLAASQTSTTPIADLEPSADDASPNDSSFEAFVSSFQSMTVSSIPEQAKV
ncbi:Thermophilic serine proteinase precursor [Rubripirellula obstinata]|uniref:Thermophilic serine proteinase n=1 Tax=Rubripirellula obstinata TaxID=406547 RepID=A0A5B1CQL0_9BACT|nr:S8 family serine peptidase [Rubripirellula obstinata]KAA1261683.1 Thermophilic serine proteinase precursor [Rubripirellula obstinata]